MKAFVFALTMAVSGAASAQIMPNSLLEILVGAQSEQRSGYLAKDKSGSALAFSLHIFSPVDKRSFFDLQFTTSHFTASNAGAFPYAGGEDLTVATSSLVPCLGFGSYGDDRGSFFVGAGFTHMRVWQKSPLKQDQSYGTFLWQVGSRYQLTDTWSANLKLTYFDVDATVNDEDTFFAAFATRLELGYAF